MADDPVCSVPGLDAAARAFCSALLRSCAPARPRFDGGAGDDWLTGGVGLDTFVIKPGFGRDTITDFGATGANQDLLQVSTSVFATMQAFMAASRQVGTDVMITATPNDVLTLQNVALAVFLRGRPSFLGRGFWGRLCVWMSISTVGVSSAWRSSRPGGGVGGRRTRSSRS